MDGIAVCAAAQSGRSSNSPNVCGGGNRGFSSGGAAAIAVATTFSMTVDGPQQQQ